ncbi:MAG: ABC transporter substrate-binding protein, partial [Lachnospiraceae bacterium]
VTSQAQDSEEYQEYLSREGEDNNTYYPVKLQASKLLLDHAEDTFVTAVFNGSASLRDAAGQLIENVTKSVRRKKEIDDAFIEKLYSDVTSLCHLDQIQADGSSGKKELGPLPKTSVVLLTVLGVIWGVILLYLLAELVKKRKYQKENH